MVNTVDYHIHFALNCGAKSCPPIVAYQAETVSKQLRKNTEFYLGNKVKVPAMIRWFSADFGGNTVKRKILKAFDLIPKNSDPEITYLNYDWTIKVENYKSYRE